MDVVQLKGERDMLQVHPVSSRLVASEVAMAMDGMEMDGIGAGNRERTDHVFRRLRLPWVKQQKERLTEGYIRGI